MSLTFLKLCLFCLWCLCQFNSVKTEINFGIDSQHLQKFPECGEEQETVSELSFAFSNKIYFALK